MFSKPVEVSLPLLQKRGRGLSHSLLYHAPIRRHSSVLHGAGSGSISTRGTHFCMEDLPSVERSRVLSLHSCILRRVLLQRHHLLGALLSH